MTVMLALCSTGSQPAAARITRWELWVHAKRGICIYRPHFNDAKLDGIISISPEFSCSQMMFWHGLCSSSPPCSASSACCLWALVMTWLVSWAGEASATTTLSCCRSWRSWRGPPPKCWTGEGGGMLNVSGFALWWRTKPPWRVSKISRWRISQMNKLMNARSKPDPPLVYVFLKGSVQEQATKLISQKH